MTVASDRKSRGWNMRRRFLTIFFVLVIVVLVIFYIANEDFRDQVIGFQTDFSKKLSSKHKNKPTVSSHLSSNKVVKHYENSENDIEVNDNIDTTMRTGIKTRVDSQKVANYDKSLTEEDDITSAEINKFHDQTDKELQVESEDGIVDSINTGTTAPITTEGLVKQKGELKKRYPTAIIAGVKKCGTRALLSFLSRHPLVRSAGKEMHFFDKNDTYARGLQWYLEQMPESYENEITIEKTPAYFVQPYVPERLFNFSKSVKLIFIFREPVKRAVSDYAQALANQKTTRFEKSIFIQKTKPRKINEKASKVNIGLYDKHLLKWLHYFPKIQMHFVDGDAFVRNPVPAIVEVQKFLGLPVLLNERSFVYNETKGFYCVRNMESGGDDSKCLGESKGRPHPEVKPSSLQKLTDFYKPHNERFFEMIGKNFGWSTTTQDSALQTKS